MNHRLTITSAIATLAASMALIPLISGGKWFFGGLGAIILTAAVGTATRHRALRALPVVVCLLCALAVLLLYLNLIYASRYSYLRLIPSPHSLSYLWHATVTGLHDTRKYTAPVPPIPGLEFLASGGIGLVAVLTDLIAVRLRRSALAGLPLLVLFSVPVATNASKNTTENTILFCIGMAGYLALLSADGRERLRLWGRLVTPWNAAHSSEPDGELGAGPSARALAASGRRVGLAAVVLALFFPLLIPGLHAHKLFHGDGGSGPGTGSGTGTGGGVDASVDPLVQMTQGLQQAKPTDVFSYTTNDPDPQYLVEYVLDKLSPTQASWVPPSQKSMTPVSAGHLLPKVPGLGAAHVLQVRTTVHMQVAATLDQSFLPLPYAPRVLVTVPHNGLLVDPYNLLVWSPLANLTDVSYTVESYHVAPTQAQFAAATAKPIGMGSYLTVPAPLHPLISLARLITEGDSTPYARAQALQGWLQDPSRFTYDVHAKRPDNVHALHNFLYNNRRGYCQQFSFAMTVLARLLGIPARVAVGYDRGTYQGHGRYEVQTSDEHAWTQLYFAGIGWTTWDATPAGTQVGQTNAQPPSYTDPATTGNPGGSPSGPSGPNAGKQELNPTHGRVPNEVPGLGGITGKLVGGVQGNGATGVQGSGSGPPVLLIVLAALILVALAAPRAARSWTRRRRWMTAHGDAGRAHAAWAELLDNIEDLGIGHGPGETPRALATRIAGQQKLTGETRAALDRLARAEELASYAREPGPASTLAADLAAVRSALAASVRRTARWRARLLPLSSAGRLRQAAVQALDVYGTLEIAATRLVARIARSRTRQA